MEGTGVGAPETEAAMKEELQRLVEAVLQGGDGDDFDVGAADRAVKILCTLKDLKLKHWPSVSVGMDNPTSSGVGCAVPDEFRCPISGELMKDPVVLATGQTYDRPFIQKWLKDGHRTCPQSQQVLSHTVLTPNLLVREMILDWCKKHGMEQPNPIANIDHEVLINADRGHLNLLLEKMTSSLSDQKEAAKRLRLLTKRVPSFRSLFSESTNAIPQLLYPLSLGSANTHPDLQEDLITILLNLSIHDSNKKLVAENPAAIPLLVESLKSGTIETRSSAAAALFTLSALESNKSIIGKLGALKPLIDLLDEGHLLAMKDAASAIFNLCLVHENKGRAICDGAVIVIMRKIADRILVDELLAVLAVLSSHEKAIEEMGELGAVPCLLSIIKENTCDRSKENCVAILYTICSKDRSKLWEIMEEENANGTISSLAQSGTPRAKRKANGILERLDKIISFAYTS
ncbi:U-box domain-containing protein 9-like [Diospyros lotus]|uniref:U-box domain-containing protein 9-like n=1 Tax=Diospyros lotus TaxID=55363 RepID=UPI0022538E0A|nr:U-box domain-containing protein 9-like [Diospyros lotus]XP_052187919.1 U-box domain-containing protein 9-like [Diospyros lotus]XP_052187920.1 U-box domain-containing protein 9-like [Diospyros lotus]XP_052187921.1 U-box domain-containing protein 9-like [Diospyros lotus]XP_052187922.1 U-box domain-containing protein 9-like [Diospyros lotus]XP_052187923.1 U-box domain-containing protein 9-like [Diospyros lotus]